MEMRFCTAERNYYSGLSFPFFIFFLEMEKGKIVLCRFLTKKVVLRISRCDKIKDRSKGKSKEKTECIRDKYCVCAASANLVF